MKPTNAKPATALTTQQLAFPGFNSTAMGLVANKTPTREQWEETGKKLGAINQVLVWFIGDWLLAGESGPPPSWTRATTRMEKKHDPSCFTTAAACGVVVLTAQADFGDLRAETYHGSAESLE